MQQFTPQGQTLINDIARRYNLSYDAVVAMLDAVMRGNGSMAQFNIPELGGSGQWMMGGMTMVGDMFNSGLQSTVDNLCVELSNLLANQPDELFPPAPAQSQMQSSMNANNESVSLFVNNPQTMGNNNWWSDDLGVAASTGGQNNVRYTYFPSTQRLAIEIDGQVTVYDALDHQISGFSQQQGGNDSLSFFSQYGLVSVANLPVVTPTGGTDTADNRPSDGDIQAQDTQNEATHHTVSEAEGMNIFSMLEQLGVLKEKGILTEEEFTHKKAELLSKL